MQCVENCNDPDPKRHVLYEQPVWQTLQMFRTWWPHISSPYYPPIRLTRTHMTFRHSWRNALYVLFPSFLPMSRTLMDVFHWHPCWVGFIPILYSAVSARWRRSSIRLPDESSDDSLDGLSESQKFPQEKLTGRRVLLLWLPALCDLTGTTVRTFTYQPHYAPRANHLCIHAAGFYSS
jgi:hypothetical protein